MAPALLQAGGQKSAIFCRKESLKLGKMSEKLIFDRERSIKSPNVSCLIGRQSSSKTSFFFPFYRFFVDVPVFLRIFPEIRAKKANFWRFGASKILWIGRSAQIQSVGSKLENAALTPI